MKRNKESESGSSDEERISLKKAKKENFGNEEMSESDNTETVDGRNRICSSERSAKDSDRHVEEDTIGSSKSICDINLSHEPHSSRDRIESNDREISFEFHPLDETHLFGDLKVGNVEVIGESESETSGRDREDISQSEFYSLNGSGSVLNDENSKVADGAEQGEMLDGDGCNEDYEMVDVDNNDDCKMGDVNNSCESGDDDESVEYDFEDDDYLSAEDEFEEETADEGYVTARNSLSDNELSSSGSSGLL